MSSDVAPFFGCGAASALILVFDSNRLWLLCSKWLTLVEVADLEIKLLRFKAYELLLGETQGCVFVIDNTFQVVIAHAI